MVLILEHSSTILWDFKANLTFGFSCPDFPHVIMKVSHLHSSECLSNLSVLWLSTSPAQGLIISPLDHCDILRTQHFHLSLPCDDSLTVVTDYSSQNTHLSTALLKKLSNLQHNTNYAFCMNPSLVPASELFAFPVLPFFFINTTTEALITKVLTFYLVGYMSLFPTGL